MQPVLMCRQLLSAVHLQSPQVLECSPELPLAIFALLEMMGGAIMKLVCAVLIPLVSLCAAESLPPIKPIVRLLPPAGVAIAPAALEPLRREIAALRTEMAGVKSTLLPDVEVYVNAAALAVENGEFYQEKDTALAAQQLATARKRLAELNSGKPSWTQQRGLVVRGYRSQIDGSAQPFGVEIPPDYDFKSKPGPMYVWLHGRGDKETNLYFLKNRESKKGQFAVPAGTIAIHPFGRHCVGFKSAGEIDVLDAAEAARTMYPVDQNRVALMGFSMGGAGAWHIGAHYPDKWAIVHPGAGFVDVRRYKGVNPDTVPVVERTLWGVYDVPDYARNFLGVPLVAYSGEKDKQKAAADIMEAELKSHGLAMQHFIGPGMEHKYHPEVQKQVQAVIDEALRKGREALPRELHFQTKTLRYNRCHWLEITELNEPWVDSRVDAKLDGATLKVTTQNIQGFKVDSRLPFKTLEIDGTPVGESIRHYVKLGGGWQGVPPDYGRSAYPAKAHALQGPMDDVLLTPFLVVLPSGNSSPRVDRWVEFESAHFLKFWREIFRGEARVKKDTEITAADLKTFSIIAFGDPQSNRLIAKAAPSFPAGIKWDAKSFVLDKRYESAGSVPAFAMPSPWAPQRYVVINNGCSFREGHCTTNALQNPKLGDWAVFDLSQDPDALSAGKIAAGGFFDNHWQLAPQSN